MKRLTYVFLCLSLLACESKTNKQQPEPSKPKLVVGIVVDQMRPDYLERYYDTFGEGGFKRLINKGFVNKNVHYNYIPTKTAPGHTSIYSGTTPAVHGIVGNDWYDRTMKRNIKNCQDTATGVLSPVLNLSSTITDQIRLSSLKKSKVISVSLKDRGAILPGGHIPNDVLWYDSRTGNFITSSYYGETPSWAVAFNNRKLSDSLISITWETLLPMDRYTASGPDDRSFEEVFKGKERPVFPYILSELFAANRTYEVISESPFGNYITNQLAMAALDAEKLGQDEYVDFLAISYSSTDKVGHSFGPYSIELQDTYLRLDQDIAELLSKLDSEVGKGNYLVFLTADHGVMDCPGFLIENKMNAGALSWRTFYNGLQDAISARFGEGKWVESTINEQIYFNRELISSKKLTLDQVRSVAMKYIQELDFVSEVYSAEVFQNGEKKEGSAALLQNGYHVKRSGDILFTLKEGLIFENTYGTNHGSGYTYDTHVPLIWYGWGISPGVSYDYHPITSIVPTLSALLNVPMPSSANADPIEELFDK